MSPLEIKDGIGWKPDPTRPGWKITVTDSDYVAEIERLRAALKPFAQVARGERLNPTPDEWQHAIALIAAE